MRLHLLLLFLIFSARVSADPVVVKGHTIGMSLLEFQQRHDRPVPADAEIRAPAMIFDDRLRARGLVRCTPDIPFENKVGGNQTIAGVAAEVTYFFICETLADWDLLASCGRPGHAKWAVTHNEAAARTRLSKVQARFEGRDYPAVKAALLEKFGRPTTETAGETMWWKNETRIQLNQRSSVLTKGFLVYQALDDLDKESAFEKEAAKAAAKDL